MTTSLLSGNRGPRKPGSRYGKQGDGGKARPVGAGAVNGGCSSQDSSGPQTKKLASRDTEGPGLSQEVPDRSEPYASHREAQLLNVQQQHPHSPLPSPSLRDLGVLREAEFGTPLEGGA